MAEDDLPIRDDVTIPGWELWWTSSRSGGPGGQHANKTETRVTLHWVPERASTLSDHQKQRVIRRLRNQLTADGELQVSAADERSQRRNLKIARERLAATIRKALKRPKRRIRTKPSRAAKRRRLEEKRQRGRLKEKRQNPKPRDWKP